jgi:oxygen-independent coproporphyrinogen-3 oxidase
VSGTGEYISMIREHRSPVVERREMSRHERLQEAMFTGLRLVDGVDVDVLGRRYDADIPALYGSALEPYRADGLVAWEGSRIRLSRRGMLLANEILSVFV